MDASPAKVSATSNQQNAVDFITSLLDASTEYAIICIDIDGRILLWNEGARLIYGYQAEEVAGRANFFLLHIAPRPAAHPAPLIIALPFGNKGYTGAKRRNA